MSAIHPLAKNRRNQETVTMKIISSVTQEAVSDLLRGVGFRAETISAGTDGAVIRSASNGVYFEARLFTPLREPAGSFADLTFTSGMLIQGRLAAEIVNHWNATKRFGRLHLVQGLLVLTMDVLLQEGISEAHLRAQLGLWDRLISELLLYLRSITVEAAPPATGAAAVPGATQGGEGEASGATGEPPAANGHARPEAAPPQDAGNGSRPESQPMLQ